jgi:hypothetical protein
VHRLRLHGSMYCGVWWNDLPDLSGKFRKHGESFVDVLGGDQELVNRLIEGGVGVLTGSKLRPYALQEAHDVMVVVFLQSWFLVWPSMVLVCFEDIQYTPQWHVQFHGELP